MNETAPQERRPRGNADQAANDILANYFTGESQQGEESHPEETEVLDAGPDENQEQADASDAEQAAPTEEEAEPEAYTIAEYAEANGIDPSHIYNAQFVMTDGTKVSFGEMKDVYQRAGQQQREIEQYRTGLDQAREQLDRQYAALNAHMAAASIQPDEEEQNLSAQLAAYLAAERDSAYWQAQEQEDRAGAALALQKLQLKKAELQQQIGQKQQERVQRTQQAIGQMQQLAQQEIAQRIPDWHNQERRQEDWGAIKGLWERFGVPANQVDMLWSNPGAMHLSKVFVDLLREREAAKPGKKKVIPVNAMRPGGRRTSPKKDPEQEALFASAKKGNKKAQERAASALLSNYLSR